MKYYWELKDITHLTTAIDPRDLNKVFVIMRDKHVVGKFFLNEVLEDGTLIPILSSVPAEKIVMLLNARQYRLG